jgi:hypothetical protein
VILYPSTGVVWDLAKVTSLDSTLEGFAPGETEWGRIFAVVLLIGRVALGSHFVVAELAVVSTPEAVSTASLARLREPICAATPPSLDPKINWSSFRLATFFIHTSIQICTSYN